MALSEERKKKLAEQKKRALMKDIDKREAAEEEVSMTPYEGLTAKMALRKSTKQNAREDVNSSKSPKDMSRRLSETNAGEDRDLRNIKKYGDKAMAGRSFGSRQTEAKAGKRYMNGGMVMPGRGVRDTKMG